MSSKYALQQEHFGSRQRRRCFGKTVQKNKRIFFSCVKRQEILLGVTKKPFIKIDVETQQKAVLFCFT